MTSLLPANLIIALVWAAVSGDFGVASLTIGFIAGFLALWAFSEYYGQTYHRTFIAAVRLGLYFLFDLLMSSLSVAYAVLFPGTVERPRFVTMPLDVESDIGVFLTANLITLTPGTLSVDVGDDKKQLLIHAMFGEDPDAVIASCKGGMERRVREVFA